MADSRIPQLSNLASPSDSDKLVIYENATDITKYINYSDYFKSIKDNNFFLIDNSDTSKILKFELSGITTATTRTLTIPDASTTLVGTNVAQTLTSKTLTSPTITGATITGSTLTTATLTSPTITTPTGIVKGDVGLSNVDNTSDATKNAAAVTLTNKTLTTPTIGDFSNATHTHANAAGGGQLNGANAITDGTLTPAELVSGTGSSWVWQSWSPSYANLTVGNGTVTALYTQIGKTVNFRWIFQLGSTSSVGTTPTISFPVTAATGYSGGAVAENANIGVAKFLDSGIANYFGYTYMSTTTVFSPQAVGVSATYASAAGITSTVPFTWGTGDALFLTGVYEAA